MADNTRPQTPQNSMSMRDKNSPPPSPPSPDYRDSEARSSRKREREVSLEPISVVDSDTHERKDTRIPSKKNKLHLDSTAEEEDAASRSRSRSNSPSPPLGVSPPHEMKIKVRQISQGVEDLNWRNNMKGSGEVNHDAVSPPTENSTGPDNDTKELDDMKVEPVALVNGQETPEIVQPDTKATGNDIAEGTLTIPNGIPTRRDSDSEKDKGLKRKFLERGTSAGPHEGEEGVKSASESSKRLRDDADRDDSLRETKRPTPPPESEKVAGSSTSSAPKSSGFMAYASTSSPFASVKGKNIFTSTKSSTPSSSKGTPVYTPLASPSSSPFVTALGESSSSSSTPAKRSGFEAFSSVSPFVAAIASHKPVLGLNRAKSPPRRGTNPANVSAFSAYASGGTQGFALPLHKRARAGSPGSSSSLERNSTVGALGGSGADSGVEDGGDDSPSTFGERLRAGKDEEEEFRNSDSPKLTEQEVATGEEDEETIHQVRGKLYHLSDGAWKERGTGLLKINVRSTDESSTARLIMRKEAVYAVLLNVTLFYGMQTKLATDPRFFQFSAIENGVAQSYNLKLANAKIAQELKEEIDAHIPKA